MMTHIDKVEEEPKEPFIQWEHHIESITDEDWISQRDLRENFNTLEEVTILKYGNMGWQLVQIIESTYLKDTFDGPDKQVTERRLYFKKLKKVEAP